MHVHVRACVRACVCACACVCVCVCVCVNLQIVMEKRQVAAKEGRRCLIGILGEHM